MKYVEVMSIKISLMEKKMYMFMCVCVYKVGNIYINI